MHLTNCPAPCQRWRCCARARRLGGALGALRLGHSALEVSLLEMLKAAKYGWGWRREVTLFSEGEGDNVSKRRGAGG
jgi:hypothetical protein